METRPVNRVNNWHYHCDHPFSVRAETPLRNPIGERTMQVKPGGSTSTIRLRLMGPDVADIG